ncbi:hypothetical protein JCM8547_006228 [Rhodosporidiobolus lusitaniae]
MGANSALQSAHTALAVLRSATADITFLDRVKESTVATLLRLLEDNLPSLSPIDTYTDIPTSQQPTSPPAPLLALLSLLNTPPSPPAILHPTCGEAASSRDSQLHLSGRLLDDGMVPSDRGALGDLVRKYLGEVQAVVHSAQQLPSCDILIWFDSPSSVATALAARSTLHWIRKIHLNLSLSTPLRSHAVVVHRVPSVVDNLSLTVAVQTFARSPVVWAQALPSPLWRVTSTPGTEPGILTSLAHPQSPTPAKELAGFFRRELPSFLLSPSTITFPSSSSCIDLVFSTPLTAELVLRCGVEPAFDCDSDHEPLLLLDSSPSRHAPSERRNLKKLNVKKLRSAYSARPLTLPPTPSLLTVEKVEEETNQLTSDILHSVSLAAPLSRSSSRSDNIHRTLLCLSSSCKGGPSSIPATILLHLWPLLSSRLTSLYTACIQLGHHPSLWRLYLGVVLHKPGKDDYSLQSPTHLVNTLLARLPPSFLPLLPWLNSFLRDRKIRLVLEGELTAVLNGDCGLSQGSPLSPLLYCFFAAPLPDLFRSSSTALGYIDDVLTLEWGRTLGEAVAALQTKLRQAEGWAKKAGAAFEPSKSGWMVLSMEKAVREEGWGRGTAEAAEGEDVFGGVEEEEREVRGEEEEWTPSRGRVRGKGWLPEVESR